MATNYKILTKNMRGQALIISIIFLAILLTLMLSLVGSTFNARHIGNEHIAYLDARAIADAGISKALWCLAQSSGANCNGTFGAGYAGESNVSFGSGVFTTNLASISVGKKEITSTGYIPNSTNPKKKITLKVRAIINTETVGFHFGMQSDVGGIIMDPGSKIVGNVITNGGITGSSGAEITGDALVSSTGDERIDQQWTSGNGELLFGSNNGQEDVAQKFTISESNITSKVGVKLRKSGAPFDIGVYIVRDENGMPGTTKIGEGLIQASGVGTSLGTITTSLTSPAALAKNRSYWLVLDASPSATKNYYIEKDSSDGYASGTAKYSDDWDNDPWNSASGDFVFNIYVGGYDNEIKGLIVGVDAQATKFSNGTVGQDLKVKKTISNATVGRDAYANSINNSNIGRDAYADTITNSSVGGTTNSGAGVDEPELQTFPVTETMIDNWKEEAGSGGVHNGDFTTDINEVLSLGPKKITGNMTLANGTELTLNGVLYVQGNIQVGNNVTIRLSPGYGDASGVVIADGILHTGENDVFQGSSQAGSYLMLLSTAMGGGGQDSAIEIDKSTDGVIFAAPYGKIYLHQNVAAKQVTGFLIHIENNGTITYETGLQSTTFSTGPSGGWSIEEDTWREIP